MMQRILGRRKLLQVVDYLTAGVFLNPLHAHGRQEAITSLAQLVRPLPGVSTEAITAAVLERESILPTGLGNGVALPHARLAGLSPPVMTVGLSHPGVDFNAGDGAQLDILAEIRRTFQPVEVRERALEVQSYTEFLALLRSESRAA